MKKLIFVALIFLLAGTSCSGRETVHGNPYEPIYVNEDNAYKIFELETVIAQLQEIIVTYQSDNLLMKYHIGDLNMEIRALERQSTRLFAHGQNEIEVRENFMDFFHTGEFPRRFEEFIGIPFHYMHMFYSETTIGENYLIAHMDWANFSFLFHYEANQTTGEIVWKFIGYHVPGLPGSFGLYREPPEPRKFANLEDVTIRLYQFPTDAADGGPDIFGNFPYIEERIFGDSFWQEAIWWLSCPHDGGINVHDFWWEEDVLYVDLKIGMLLDISGPGFGSTVSAGRLIQTFYSFPNTRTVVFMLDGRRLPFATSEEISSCGFWWIHED